MLKNERFRILTPTLGITVLDGDRIPATIPENAIVTVTGTADVEGLLSVEWEGASLLMYVQDLEERGEVVRAAGSQNL